MIKPRIVRAHWDADAKVWWADSDDIAGLVTEAPTISELADNVVALLPDLFELNQQTDSGPIHLVYEQELKVRSRAA